MNALQELDARLFHWMNGAPHTAVSDWFFLFLSAPPHRWVLFGGVLALLLLGAGRRRWVVLLTLLGAVLVADQLSSGLLKPWVGRERPCFALDSVRLLFPRQAHSGSFPSGHATNSFAVAVVLLGHWRRAGVLALAMASLIGYSRVYVGVHYPGDILAGAILGSLVGFLALRVEAAVLARGRGAPDAPTPGETASGGR